MISQMARVAAQCITMPGRTSVWSKAAGKYVCSEDPEYKKALAQQTAEVRAEHPPIGLAFSWIVLAVVIGTVLSFGGCGVIAALSGDTPAEMNTRLFDLLADVGKVGVGAIVGLLGAQSSPAVLK